MTILDNYRDVSGAGTVKRIIKNAEDIAGLRIAHINSTNLGGGVAEILASLVPLMNDAGMDAEWLLINGNKKFFNVTKKFHNNLQSGEDYITDNDKKIYINTLKGFDCNRIRHDVVIIHDPQPLALISLCRKRQPWIWRCHIDLSYPNPETWKYIRSFVNLYDRIVVSMEEYKQDDTAVPCSVIHPAIDPLSDKNKPLGIKFAREYLADNGIDVSRPVIAQVSRFDKWKDPFGVVKIFRRVAEKVDASFVMLGSFASDDPAGEKIYRDVKKYARHEDITIIAKYDPILVNALQTSAHVIIQKSIREGFGLTVSEALWKGTPVVASSVGGIALQIVNGKNGYLLDPYDYDGFVEKIIRLIDNERLRKRMGRSGHEWIKERFLITRQLNDWINLIKEVTSV